MYTTALRRSGRYSDLRAVAGVISVLAVIAAIVWTIVWIVVGHYRGIYAGFSYPDAKRAAIATMVVQYGKDTASTMHFADPPVVNTHSTSLLVDGQIRVFHLIGARGTHYCVTVWDPNRGHWTSPNSGVWIGGDTTVVKGCRF